MPTRKRFGCPPDRFICPIVIDPGGAQSTMPFLVYARLGSSPGGGFNQTEDRRQC